jgi:hypothetical protein
MYFSMNVLAFAILGEILSYSLLVFASSESLLPISRFSTSRPLLFWEDDRQHVKTLEYSASSKHLSKAALSSNLNKISQSARLAGLEAPPGSRALVVRSPQVCSLYSVHEGLAMF